MIFFRKIFPKKRFEWKEPKAFIRFADRYEKNKRKWWHQPAICLIILSVFILKWFSAASDTEAHPPSLASMFVISALAALLFAYGLPWLIEKFPSYIVSVTPSATVKSHHKRHSVFRLSDLN
ncbi:MAG: hypothetical protein ABJC04_01910 [Verrucomicrobiota bacterium]